MTKTKSWFSVLIAIALTVCILAVMAVPAFAATSKVTVNTQNYYTLKNVSSGKYLNVYGNQNKNNANVDVYEKDGTSGQDFKFTLISSSTNSFTMTPRCATGKRVNVYGESAANKANVCLWDKTNHSTQCWIPEKVSGGYILRCANNTAYVLTATGSSNSSNVNIQKYSSGNTSQVWTCSAFSTGSTTTSTATTTTTTSSSKTLSVNWNLISKTGKQTAWGPCFCYSLAYARDILDGKVHYWTEYQAYPGTGSYIADRSKANFSATKTSSKAAALKGIYEKLKAGKPVVVCVTGDPEHYVCAIGYKNVTSTANLSESNIVVIDPNCPDKGRTLSSQGYKLYDDGNGYFYCYPK